MLYFKYSVNRSILLKFKKSVVLKSFNLRHLWCRFSYLKDIIILLAYLFARKLKTVLCGYRISDVTVAKKPLGIWYKFPIRFRPVRIPSMSRPYLTRVNNPLGRAMSRSRTLYEPHYHKPKRSPIISLRFPWSKPYAYISENGKRRGTPIICRFRILSQSPPSKRTAHSRIVSRFFCISAGYTHKLR